MDVKSSKKHLRKMGWHSITVRGRNKSAAVVQGQYEYITCNYSGKNLLVLTFNAGELTEVRLDGKKMGVPEVFSLDWAGVKGQIQTSIF